MRSRLFFALMLVTALVASGSAWAVERVVHLEPEATEVTFDLPATGHDVHGVLYLQEGEFRFDPASGEASGTITIDASRADTGRKKRDKTMHNKVLETEQFPTFRFEVTRVDGKLVEDGTSELELIGTMSIHGDEHPMTMPTTVEASNGRFQAKTKFPIPFVEWGMHDPSVLFLRVAKVVDVTVAAEGTLSGATDVAPHASRPE